MNVTLFLSFLRNRFHVISHRGDKGIFADFLSLTDSFLVAMEDVKDQRVPRAGGRTRDGFLHVG